MFHAPEPPPPGARALEKSGASTEPPYFAEASNLPRKLSDDDSCRAGTEQNS